MIQPTTKLAQKAMQILQQMELYGNTLTSLLYSYPPIMRVPLKNASCITTLPPVKATNDAGMPFMLAVVTALPRLDSVNV